MSNIERRYAYLDEGVFPVEGEYGVTYLTLYSSNAGNTYDGWVYDPENKIPVSLTARTYGYRNPDYPDYCWDDEVVVDLSNAQNRQESSEFEQGRITSFNTNVSSTPIILQDVDITGLTEEERENKATTVLFSAIPLVKDAYIQAQVEVQCKCNLSPDNTSGEMRIEAFYILNDESDRTMRPNPVHTFTVSSPNERHTLPWIYFNPALKHEDHNYIGVKLICTGGTAEIGISDDPDYGDAMITLISGGLNGDRIDDAKPVSLEIFGKEEVIGGYELDINDYTVLCTYDTGEIYEVTRMCSFTPAMGTKIIDPFTTLTAKYLGLQAHMTIRLGMIESIELMGIESFHNKLKLDIKDFTVLAFLDTGDVMDVTEECTFSPTMGTVITVDTTLTAIYQPYWMHGVSFSDSIDIEQLDVIATGSNSGLEDGLIYTLYEDNTVVITGNAKHRVPGETWDYYELIQLPESLMQYIKTSGYTLKWDAEDKVSGYSSRATSDAQYLCKGFIDFNDVQVTAFSPNSEYHTPNINCITFNFYGERDLTSNMLKWCGNVEDYPVIAGYRGSSSSPEYFWTNICYGCKAITNLDFMSNWNKSAAIVDASYAFSDCLSLKNIDGLGNLNTASLKWTDYMFAGCHQLETISGSAYWDLSSLETAQFMFQYDESLVNIDAIWFWQPDNLYNLTGMFQGIGADHVSGLKTWDKSSWRIIDYIVKGSKIIDLDGFQNLDIGLLTYTTISAFVDLPELISLNGIDGLIIPANRTVKFSNNPKLTDISALSDIDMSEATSIAGMFEYDISLKDLSPISGWNVSNVTVFNQAFRGDLSLENLQPLSGWRTSSAISMIGMFDGDDKVRYIGCLSGWDVSNMHYSGSSSPVARMFARANVADHENTHIIDAGSLNWSVPTRSVGTQGDWRCDLFPDRGANGFLDGTDVPIATTSSGKVHLSDKLYSLPYWYYHNDSSIDETQ